MADCDDEHVDRISDLPTNVIDSILQRLPIKDLVKTSVLSRAWRYMWSSTPRLEFRDDFFEKLNRLGYFYLQTSSIITEALLLHTGPIHNFAVIPPPYYPIKLECLTKWILFLSRKGVKYIRLASQQEDPYRMPTHIFSCRDLTYLYLDNFRFSVAPTFRGFSRMIELHLFGIIFESGALESLLSGCPLLVNLHLSHCSGFEHIDVSAPFLQSLMIDGEEVIKSIRLKEPQNLILIKLFADGPGYNIDRAWVADLLKDSPNTERLFLGTSYIKILSAGIYQHVQLRAIKYLELDGVDFNEARELLFIISLLHGSSSNIETLTIKCNSMAVELHQILGVFDYCNCYFNQLQDVKITVKTSYKPALGLIRFVLARSPALKILTFRVGLGLNGSDASVLLSISRDLLQMGRASPRAEVKFLYDDLSE